MFNLFNKTSTNAARVNALSNRDLFKEIQSLKEIYLSDTSSSENFNNYEKALHVLFDRTDDAYDFKEKILLSWFHSPDNNVYLKSDESKKYLIERLQDVPSRSASTEYNILSRLLLLKITNKDDFNSVVNPIIKVLIEKFQKTDEHSYKKGRLASLVSILLFEFTETQIQELLKHGYPGLIEGDLSKRDNWPAPDSLVSLTLRMSEDQLNTILTALIKGLTHEKKYIPEYAAWALANMASTLNDAQVGVLHKELMKHLADDKADWEVFMYGLDALASLADRLSVDDIKQIIPLLFTHLKNAYRNVSQSSSNALASLAKYLSDEEVSSIRSQIIGTIEDVSSIRSQIIATIFNDPTSNLILANYLHALYELDMDSQRMENKQLFLQFQNHTDEFVCQACEKGLRSLAPKTPYIPFEKNGLDSKNAETILKMLSDDILLQKDEKVVLNEIKNKTRRNWPGLWADISSNNLTADPQVKIFFASLLDAEHAKKVPASVCEKLFTYIETLFSEGGRGFTRDLAELFAEFASKRGDEYSTKLWELLCKDVERTISERTTNTNFIIGMHLPAFERLIHTVAPEKRQEVFQYFNDLHKMSTCDSLKYLSCALQSLPRLEPSNKPSSPKI